MAKNKKLTSCTSSWWCWYSSYAAGAFDKGGALENKTLQAVGDTGKAVVTVGAKATEKVAVAAAKKAKQIAESEDPLVSLGSSALNPFKKTFDAIKNMQKQWGLFLVQLY